MPDEISTLSDTLDVRDIIERFEWLESDEAKDEKEYDEAERDEFEAEYERLKDLLDDLKGNGGDHEWKDDWYPVTLINRDYFEDYARELAEDIGAIDRQAEWPNNHIDWEAAAEDLENDYTTVDFGGEVFVPMNELQPKYDSRNSFYGKAQVIENPDEAVGDEHTKVLLSYQTTVAAIRANGTAVVFGWYSNTTGRHIKEFLLQNGFKAESKKQIMEDYSEPTS